MTKNTVKKKLSEDHKRKIGLSNKNNPIHKESGRRVGKSNLGKKLPEEQKKAISLGNKGNPKSVGENHWNWKGGITPDRKKAYFSPEYKLWRRSVFERDSFTCVWCGRSGVKLHADHILPWCDYPALRFAIDNGRTLCTDCHKKTPTYGTRRRIKQ